MSDIYNGSSSTVLSSAKLVVCSLVFSGSTSIVSPLATVAFTLTADNLSPTMDD